MRDLTLENAEKIAGIGIFNLCRYCNVEDDMRDEGCESSYCTSTVYGAARLLKKDRDKYKMILSRAEESLKSILKDTQDPKFLEELTVDRLDLLPSYLKGFITSALKQLEKLKGIDI